MQETILIVDDDREVRNLLSTMLTRNNFKACAVANTHDASRHIKQDQPDLILLDIDLPLENGIDFCRKLHTKSPIPTIMLTASDDDIDRVLSYEVGADHYITKPFNPKVLIAAIKAVLRRSLELQNDKLEQKCAQYAYFKDWCFNIKERSLTHITNGISIELTTKEFEVLQLLIEYHGEPLSRDSLIMKLYGREYNGLDRNLDMMVLRIRRKIENDHQTPQIIKTIHGTGYMFSSPIRWETSTEGILSNYR